MELTPRELEVVKLTALGRSTKEIGRALGMEAGTAKQHRQNIYKKLGIGSTAEVGVYAAKQGLV